MKLLERISIIDLCDVVSRNLNLASSFDIFKYFPSYSDHDESSATTSLCASEFLFNHMSFQFRRLRKLLMFWVLSQPKKRCCQLQIRFHMQNKGGEVPGFGAIFLVYKGKRS